MNTCEFQSLFFGDEGYIVRCKRCNHIQVAFICILTTLGVDEFQKLRQLVLKMVEEEAPYAGNGKCMIIPTPNRGTCFLLTKDELYRFAEILEVADNEARAQSLISLFNA